MNRLKLIMPWLTLPLIALMFGVSGLLVFAAKQSSDASPKGAWRPAEEDRAAYRDIVDFNIFRSDRSELAEQVDRVRNPPAPTTDAPRETVEVPETPKDPDASWRLAGISHDPSGAVAYIEHTETGEITKLTGAADFSAGRITEIWLDAVVYRTEDTQREVQVGQSLLGQRVDMPGSSSAAGSSGSDTTSKPASLQDRLRELRERRAREQGGGS